MPAEIVSDRNIEVLGVMPVCAVSLHGAQAQTGVATRIAQP